MMIKTILKELSLKNETLGTAESCTGGNIAGTIAKIPGASAVLRGGIVSYHEDVKRDVLHVDPHILSHFGVVSRETAIAMALGAANVLQTDWAISVTGYAGPSGNDVGKICFGIVSPKHHIYKTVCRRFDGDRIENIQQAVNTSLNLLWECIPQKIEK